MMPQIPEHLPKAARQEDPDLRTPMSQEIAYLEIELYEMLHRLEFLRVLEEALNVRGYDRCYRA